MPFSIDFKGQTVIVTGGNRGIGWAISEALADAGASVAIVYRGSKDAPEKAKGLAEKYKVNVEAFQCDVSDEASVEKVFKEIDSHKSFGNITGLVANAGVAIPKPALELTLKDFRKTYDVNVFGVFAASKAAAKIFIEHKTKGSIVVISSMSSRIVNNQGLGEPLTQVFYNSAKHAVSGLTKCLAAEWIQYGIRVNAVVRPSGMRTDDAGPRLRQHRADEQQPAEHPRLPSERSPDEALLRAARASSASPVAPVRSRKLSDWHGLCVADLRSV